MAWARQTPGGLWQGVYRDASGQKRYLPADKYKTRAKHDAAREEDRYRRSLHADPAGPKTRWETWCDQWEPSRQIEPTTRAGNAAYLQRVHDRWDRVALGAISQHDLQTWVTSMSNELSASGVRQTFYLLSSSLNAAIGAGLLEHNPCAGVQLPTNPPAQERYLTDAEVAKVFWHLDGVDRILAELLLATGMRVSEACGLHWERVDLDAGVVRVVETWEPPAMKAFPKSGKLRAVPLTDAMIGLLVSWRDKHPDSGGCGRPHVADESRRARARTAGRVEPTSCRSSTVLVRRGGAPVDPHNFTNRQWRQAVRLAKIPGATPHALRHTYASRLVTAGVPIRRVQKLLGHASVTTTERYAHLADDGYAEVRSALAGRTESVSWRKPRAV